MLRNTTESYGWPAIALHWFMAVAIFGLFGLGLWMTRLNYYDDWYHKAPDLHQSIGMLVLVLLLLRIIWAWFNAKPVIVGAPWERIGASIVHRFHYLLMLVITTSGYLIPTAEGQGFDIFGSLHVSALLSLTPLQADINGAVHRYAAWLIIILAALHALAALKHHFVNRDATLLRMLGASPKIKSLQLTQTQGENT